MKDPADQGEQSNTTAVKEAMRRPDTLTRIVRYCFLFWGVCVVTGGGTAVGLANAGMKVQDAFNSGMAIGLLPFIAAGIVAVLVYFFG